MDNELVVVASTVALVLRVLAIGVLCFVLRLQFKQFRVNTPLQPLKRMLVALTILIIVSNLPIIKLHIDRIGSAGQSKAIVTSFATITNAASMLLIAVILYLIYIFHSDDDQYL